MPLSYPAAPSPSTGPAAHGAVAFDVSHLGTVRVDRARRPRPAAAALTNDLDQGRARAGRSTPTCSTPTTPRCSTTSSCGGSTTSASTSCPTPRTPTGVRRRAGGTGGGRRHRRRGPSSPCRAPRPGACWPRSGPRRPRSAASTSAALDVERRAECVGGRHRLHRRGRRRGRGARRARRRASGTPCSTPGVAPAGLGARDTLRLEAGLPLHGHELGPGITPLQAGLGWVVSWDKGDFRGPRRRWPPSASAGVARRLAGLAVEGRRPPRADQVVLRRRRAGRAWSPAATSRPMLGQGIALAFVPARRGDRRRAWPSTSAATARGRHGGRSPRSSTASPDANRVEPDRLAEPLRAAGSVGVGPRAAGRSTRGCGRRSAPSMRLTGGQYLSPRSAGDREGRLLAGVGVVPLVGEARRRCAARCAAGCRRPATSPRRDPVDLGPDGDHGVAEPVELGRGPRTRSARSSACRPPGTTSSGRGSRSR